LLKLCQANLKRAEVMAQEFPNVPIKTQILVGKPFQVVMQWAEEIKPSLLVLSRHGAHRIENTQMGSQAENLVRLAPCNTLMIGTVGIKPEDIPGLRRTGRRGCRGRQMPKCGSCVSHPSRRGSRGAPSRSTRSSRPAGQRPSLRTSGSTKRSRSCSPPICSSSWESARPKRSCWRRRRRPEQLQSTKVKGHDADPVPATAEIEVRCPVTGNVSMRARVATDPIIWTEEGWQRLQAVPLIARPLARNTVERFARSHDIWRVTTMVMDDNKQQMIEADEFDVETMMVMFTELRAKQIRAEAEGRDGMTPEMRAFIEEAKAQGITRCPIRDIEEKAGKCPVEFKGMKPEEAKEAMERLLQEQAGD
jgi:hypothetical protein